MYTLSTGYVGARGGRATPPPVDTTSYRNTMKAWTSLYDITKASIPGEGATPMVYLPLRVPPVDLSPR